MTYSWDVIVRFAEDLCRGIFHFVEYSSGVGHWENGVPKPQKGVLQFFPQSLLPVSNFPPNREAVTTHKVFMWGATDVGGIFTWNR